MSLYTLTISDSKNSLSDSAKALIRTDVDYVISHCIDRFVDWKGTLDFKVNIKTHADYMKEWWVEEGDHTDGLVPGTEMAWVGSKKSNLIEATTGKDLNGTQSDAGFTIYLGVDGTLKNYGAPLWLDPNPTFNKTPEIPDGQNDFVSIALHEIIHTLAFDGVSDNSSPFGGLSKRVGDHYNFSGTNINALLGGSLPITPDNHVVSTLSLPYADSGLMRDYGNYDSNRWDIGRIELAVMKDLGYDVISNLSGLSYTDIDDKNTAITGTTAADKIYGDFHDNQITGFASNDRIDGGAGNDTAHFSAGRSNYTITKTVTGYTVTDNIGTEGIDALISVERLVFTDETVSTADTAPIDLTAPTFEYLLNSSTGLDVNSNLLVYFDGDVALGSGKITLTDAKNKTIACAVSASGSSITIDPTQSLSFGTAYKINVGARALQDPSGNDVELFSIRFTTSDTFRTSQSNVNLSGAAQNLLYTGNANFDGTGNTKANTMTGSLGNDTLNGALGNDTLTGDSGNDTFVFNTKLGATNVDTITDFATGDKIALAGAIFSKLKGDKDLSDNFVLASATTTKQYLIYNPTTGKLYYDADGSATKSSPIEVAIIGIDSHATLTVSDFLIV